MALMVPLSTSTGISGEHELTADEIQELVGKLGHRDPEIVRKATAQLTEACSKENVAIIVQSLNTKDHRISNKLIPIISAIGEPAAEAIFAGSVSDPTTGKPPIPLASGVLTCHLKTTAIPVLMAKLCEGSDEERKVASWALSEITRYHGFGDHDPTELIPPLLQAALKDRLFHVKMYAAGVLDHIKHDATIPALIQLLSDEKVCGGACMALSKRGAAASDAIPVLKRGIENGTLPAHAFDALISIQGKAAVVFVVERLATWKFGPNDRDHISSALLRHPHPAAIPFMSQELKTGNPSSSVRAALFFSRLDHPAALKYMRECLNTVAEGKTERTHPTDTQVSCARDLRTIAIQYLADHADTDSYGTILQLLDKDSSIKVRTAAALALGKVAYDKAVPVLKRKFGELDKGYSHIGHVDGALHAAAVQALAQIGSEEALRVLYEGACKGHKPCLYFWQTLNKQSEFAKFLEYYQKDKGLTSATAAGIIANQLNRHARHYRIPEGRIGDARKAFLACVRDAKHFDPGVDLTERGMWEVKTTFEFYTIDFAVVSFTFTAKDRRRHGYGYTMLYTKDGGVWVPMGRVAGYTE